MWCVFEQWQFYQEAPRFGTACQRNRITATMLWIIVRAKSCQNTWNLVFSHISSFLIVSIWFRPAESKSVECQSRKFEQFCTDAKTQDGRQKPESVQIAVFVQVFDPLAKLFILHHVNNKGGNLISTPTTIQDGGQNCIFWVALTGRSWYITPRNGA